MPFPFLFYGSWGINSGRVAITRTRPANPILIFIYFWIDSDITTPLSARQKITVAPIAHPSSTAVRSFISFSFQGKDVKSMSFNCRNRHYFLSENQIKKINNSRTKNNSDF